MFENRRERNRRRVLQSRDVSQTRVSVTWSSSTVMTVLSMICPPCPRRVLPGSTVRIRCRPPPPQYIHLRRRRRPRTARGIPFHHL